MIGSIFCIHAEKRHTPWRASRAVKAHFASLNSTKHRTTALSPLCKLKIFARYAYRRTIVHKTCKTKSSEEVLLRKPLRANMKYKIIDIFNLEPRVKEYLYDCQDRRGKLET